MKMRYSKSEVDRVVTWAEAKGWERLEPSANPYEIYRLRDEYGHLAIFYVKSDGRCTTFQHGTWLIGDYRAAHANT